MVCYCEERKILYIHIPKTGGITVDSILRRYYGFKKFTFSRIPFQFLADEEGKEGIYKYILRYSNEAKLYDLKTFFKFSFVRDPYDRAISAANFIFRTITAKQKLNIPFNTNKFLFNSNRIHYIYMHVNLSQYESLVDEYDVVNFDFIGRTETLMRDLKYVLFDILKLPEKQFEHVHHNKTKTKIENVDENKIGRYINSKMRQDFDQFGFTMKTFER